MVQDDSVLKLETIIGLVLIGISFMSQVAALIIMRILHKLNQGGNTVVLRMWLYLACGLDQVSFFIFHLKYHILETDFEFPDACIMIRFLASCTSTFTMTWIFVITAFYFGLTTKPSKCFTYHARFLAFCFTHTWTGVSSLLYVMMAFLLRRIQHRSILYPCWDNIKNTIHLYLTYGNELIVLVFIIAFASLTRMRIWYKERQIEIFSHTREFEKDFTNLKHKVNILLLMTVLICLYYTCLLFRIVIEGVGSDMSIMILHSIKGLIIVMTTCFLDKQVVNLLRCRFHHSRRNSFAEGPPPETDRNVETFV